VSLALIFFLVVSACEAGVSEDIRVADGEEGSTSAVISTTAGNASGEPNTTILPTSPTVADIAQDAFAKGRIPAVLAADGRFKTLLGLLETHSPLQLALIGGPTFNHSFLAPTDDAFAQLAQDGLESHFVDEIRTRDFFHRHVITGSARSSADLIADVRSSDGFVPVIANAGYLLFSVGDGDVLQVVLCELDGAECRPLVGMRPVTLIETDFEASNGLIHIIDGVLIPPDN
jgi:uncharacterized surface protein with fasciclin (FAS1) repeats